MAWSYTVATTTFNPAVIDHDCNLGGPAAAGDLLLLGFACKPAGINEVITGPAGWTLKVAPPSSRTLSVYGFKAAGGETVARVSTPNNATVGIAKAVRIPAAAWSGNLAEAVFSAFAEAINDAPNPPSVSAPGTGEENLYVVFVGSSDDDGTIDAFSANYVDGETTAAGAGTNASAAIAVQFRVLTADSDDPGVMSLTQSEDWAAATGVIKPAAAAGNQASGAPQSGSATVEGAAKKRVKAAAALAAGEATVAGAAKRRVKASGALVAGAATVSGTVSVGGVKEATGALAAGAATVAGTAKRRIKATGALQAGAASVSGSALAGGLETLIREDLFKPASEQAWLQLLTIEHPNLEDALRVAHNREDVTSRGELYVALDMQLQLPAQTPTRSPNMRVKLGNVDRRIVQTLRALKGEDPPLFKLEAVMSGDLDRPVYVEPDFELRNWRADNQFVTGELAADSELDDEYALTYTPANAKGVFL